MSENQGLAGSMGTPALEKDSLLKRLNRVISNSKVKLDALLILKAKIESDPELESILEEVKYTGVIG